MEVKHAVASSLLFAVLVCSCASEGVLLPGDWQAISITEGGDTLKVNKEEVGFTFTPQQRYHFRSTLRYEEAGTWRMENGYLFATDTTQPDRPERVVAIELLNQDSLVLRMKAEAAERTMVLTRR